MVPDGEPARVLVVVQGDRDRELLTRRLDKQYQVIFPQDGSIPDEFDCCVVDDRSLSGARADLGRRRADAEPVALPVLLLARSSDRGPDPWVRFREDIGEVVDDVATLPLGEGELDVRLSSLLRTRRMSRALEDRRGDLERYEQIVETTDEQVFATDADWTIRTANQAMLDFHDVSREELVGEPVLDLILEDDEERIDEVGDRLRDGETVTMTTRVADGSGEVRVFEPRLAPMFDGDGFSGVVGVARDVTENRQLEADLREERELLSRLFETSPVAITVLDTDGEVVRANDRAKDILRLDPSQIVGREFDAPEWEIFGEDGAEVPPDDLPFARVMRTGEPVFDYEHGIRSPDGEEVWLSINAAPLHDEAGEIENVVAALQDVTERVERERERERERARLSLALEGADAGVWEWNADTDEVVFDDKTREVFNLDPEDSGNSFEEALEHVHPEDREQVEAEFWPAVEQGDGYQTEVRIVEDDGSVRWIAVNATVISADEGSSTRVIGIVTDVTERVERERQLQDEQTRLSLAMDAADAGVWSLDPETEEVIWDDRTCKLHGYSPSEFDGTYESAAANIDAEDLQEVERRIEGVLETGGSYEVEYRVHHPTDGLVWIESHASVLLGDEGDPQRIIGIVRDVTDRVEREHQLEHEQARLSLALESADAAVWEWDLGSNDLTLSDQALELFGLDPTEYEDPVAALTERTAAVDRIVSTVLEDAGTGESFSTQFRYERPDGSPGWMVTRGRLLDDDGGQGRVLGVMTEVTERVERERKLERTVDLYDQTQSIANIGGWEVDMESGDVLWTAEVFEILEIDGGDEPSLDEAMQYYHEDDRADVSEAIEEAADTGGTFDLEVEIDTDAVRKWVRVRGQGIHREDREPLVRGTFQDVTDRKQYEQTLERFETIVQTAEDPIFTTDAHGRFSLVNDALVGLTEYSRMELVGRHARGTVWDEEAYDHEAMVEDLLAGESVQITAMVQPPERTVREFALSISPLFEDGEYAGAVGVGRDITDVRERERRLSVLDRVLRHNLRNKLNLVMAYADAIEGQASDPDVAGLGADIGAVSDELLDLSQKARAFEASIDPAAGSVHTVDLADRVASAVEDVRSAHPHARFVVNAPESALVRASETIDLALGELLENAVVHADVDRPTVEVALDRDGEEYRLRITDEGPGIGPVERAALVRGEETQLEHSTGLGLWLVRWSITAAGGRLAIRDRDPRGTEIAVALPVTDEQTLDVETDGGE